MKKSPISRFDPEADNIYLKIWEIEQKHTTTRWTVTTFFLSISFAIFGISLQIENSTMPRLISHILAIAIYWFTYLLFLRFNDFTTSLREYLNEIESSGKTSIKLQTHSKLYMSRRKKPSATRLLLYFGIAYTITGVIIGYLY